MTQFASGDRIADATHRRCRKPARLPEPAAKQIQHETLQHHQPPEAPPPPKEPPPPDEPPPLLPPPKPPPPPNEPQPPPPELKRPELELETTNATKPAMITAIPRLKKNQAAKAATAPAPMRRNVSGLMPVPAANTPTMRPRIADHIVGGGPCLLSTAIGGGNGSPSMSLANTSVAS